MRCGRWRWKRAWATPALSLRPSGSGQNVGIAFGRGFFDLSLFAVLGREGLHRGEGEGAVRALTPLVWRTTMAAARRGVVRQTREEECGDGALPRLKKKGKKRPRAVV